MNSVKAKAVDIHMRGERRERKGAAALLFSKLGLGGMKAGQSWSSALLATKSGLLGLCLTAAAGAGGIGYVLSAPDHSPMRAGARVFEGKEGPMAGLPDAQHPEAFADKDGTSASLTHARQANTGSLADVGAAADEGLKEEAAAEVSSGVEAPNNSLAGEGSVSAAAEKRPTLQRAAGFQSSSSGSSGAAGAGAKPADSQNAVAQRDLAGAGRAVSTGGFSRSPSTGRLTAARGQTVNAGRSASEQAISTRRIVTQASATPNISSVESGATYDGGRGAAAAAAGAEASMPTAGGTGPAPEGISSKPNASTVQNFNRSTPPPAIDRKKAKNVTPYQKLATAAMALIAVGTLLLMAAGFLKKQADEASDPISKSEYAWWSNKAAWAAAIAGAGAAMIGLMLIGQPGQLMQGGIYMAMGGIIAVAAVWVAMDSEAGNTAKAQMEADAKHLVDTQMPGSEFNGVDGSGQVSFTNPAGETGTFQLEYPSGTGSAALQPTPGVSAGGMEMDVPEADIVPE